MRFRTIFSDVITEVKNMEALLFITMVGSFVGLAALRLPISIALLFSSIVGAVISDTFSISRLVEGAFGYFDAILIIATAMIFMNSIKESGLLKDAADVITFSFRRYPRTLLIMMTLFIMSAGMITGSSTAAVLTTGAIAFPVLTSLGLDRKTSGALIAMSSIFGMIAPPVNIPVMIIGQGVDMPYIGFTYPLLWLTVPLALLTALLLAGRNVKLVEIKVRKKKPQLILYIPFLLLIVLNILDALRITSFGLSLMFIICALSANLTAKKFNFFKTSIKALSEALPILSILAGVGMFIEVMTMSGVRGFIVSSLISIPTPLLYITIGIGIPAFGAVSSFGAASVLGVPFLLAFLGGNDIIVASALSLVAGLGDMVPPTALAGIFASHVVGEKNYFVILKKSFAILVLVAVFGVTTVAFSRTLSVLFNSAWILCVLITALIAGVFLSDIFARREL